MRFAFAAIVCSGLLAAAEFPVGSKIESFDLTLNGSPAQVKPSAAKATAVVFVSTGCPVSNAYNQRFKELHADYAQKGVQMVFVNSNSNESQADIDAHSASNGFAFQVHKDVDNVLADKLNAQYTPEVFLFDQKGTLVYHGRIDDNRDLARMTTKDTRAALDAVLAGKAVAVTDTKAFGCTIKRVKKTS